MAASRFLQYLQECFKSDHSEVRHLCQSRFSARTSIHHNIQTFNQSIIYCIIITIIKQLVIATINEVYDCFFLKNQ